MLLLLAKVEVFMTLQFVILVIGYIALIALAASAVRHFAPPSATTLEIKR